MRIRTLVRHFCRGFMLGIGAIPVLLILRAGLNFEVNFELMLNLLLLCGLVSCLLIPIIQRFVVYFFIERPFIRAIQQQKAPRQQLVHEIDFTLAQAYKARYISDEQYQGLQHKLLQMALRQRMAPDFDTAHPVGKRRALV
ncbi:MAG: hypothetical protein AAF614_44020 [Chloroflexota bacterium]